MFLVGQFNINPRDLPDGKLIDEWYPVKSRPNKKDGVTGDILKDREAGSERRGERENSTADEAGD